MKSKGLFSIEEFLNYKNSKDVKVKLVGDISSLSKFEVEINKKYKKLASIEIQKKNAILKTKDYILEELKSIASSYGISFDIEHVNENYKFTIRHSDIHTANVYTLIDWYGDYGEDIDYAEVINLDYNENGEDQTYQYLCDYIAKNEDYKDEDNYENWSVSTEVSDNISLDDYLKDKDSIILFYNDKKLIYNEYLEDVLDLTFADQMGSYYSYYVSRPSIFLDKITNNDKDFMLTEYNLKKCDMDVFNDQNNIKKFLTDIVKKLKEV